MPNVNVVILCGNLCRDPETRTTAGGTSLCKFSLAVNRKWKDQAGELKEEATFVDVTAWGKTGEVVAQYTRKGDPLLIEGRLQLEQWTSREGEKRSKLSVVAERVQLMGKKGDDGGGGQRGAGARASQEVADATSHEGNIPF
jgi:single-strand DNA-binding protein